MLWYFNIFLFLFNMGLAIFNIITHDWWLVPINVVGMSAFFWLLWTGRE